VEPQRLELREHRLEALRPCMCRADQQPRRDLRMLSDEITRPKQVPHLGGRPRRWKMPERFLGRSAPLDASGLQLTCDEGGGLRRADSSESPQGLAGGLIVGVPELLRDRCLVTGAGEPEGLHDGARR